MAMRSSDELVALNPYEALSRQPEILLGDGPDAGKPRVVVLNLKRRAGVQYAEDIGYEVTDNEGRAIPGRRTEFWEGTLLPLASEPDIWVVTADFAPAN
jgi:hypothetical protein